MIRKILHQSYGLALSKLGPRIDPMEFLIKNI